MNNFSIGYDRLSAIFSAKKTFLLKRLLQGEVRNYYFNLYNYVISQLMYRLTDTNINYLKEAKVYLEELSSEHKSGPSEGFLEMYRGFQKDFSFILLRLSESDVISNIYAEVPDDLDLIHRITKRELDAVKGVEIGEVLMTFSEISPKDLIVISDKNLKKGILLEKAYLLRKYLNEGKLAIFEGGI